MRSSVGKLALPFRPLYNRMSLLSFYGSHFNFTKMPVIVVVPCYKSGSTFAHFLIHPEDLHSPAEFGRILERTWNMILNVFLC